jgi:cleavage and polyadenylation specificity factor subunit 1
MHLLQSSMKMPNTAEFLGGSPGPMDIDEDDAGPLHQILHTSQSGTLALITPLSESSYRRLSGLATFLANTLDSAAGLNPRAFRAVENELGGGGGTRGILDGNLLMRWSELGEQKRREGLGKVGADEWVFRAEREVLSGRGVFGTRF